MHSEKEIRQAISTLLQRYGDLSTAEVKVRLSEVLTFDADDQSESPTRPGECKIMQRIGNIVSHQSDQFYIYEEGFAVDKSDKPARFTLNFNRQQEGTPAAGAVDPNLQPGIPASGSVDPNLQLVTPAAGFVVVNMQPGTPSAGYVGLNLPSDMPSAGYVGFNMQPGTPSEGYVGFNMQPGTPSAGYVGFNMQPGMPSEGYVGFNMLPGTPSAGYVGFNMQPGTPSAGYVGLNLPSDMPAGGVFAPHLAQGSHSAQQIDWDAVNERRTSLGKSGEAFVLRYEVERVRSFAPQLAEYVCHVSEREGDGLGYDIRSVNCRGETIYIEVKTTQGGADTPFYMSINELTFFSANPNNAFIYRVYDFDPVIGTGEVRVISGQELLAQYALAPISFSVRPR